MKFSMSSLLSMVSAAVVFSGLSISVYAENYVEPGRFGVEGVVTANTFQGGFVYVNDWLDVAFDFKAEHVKEKFSHTGDTAQRNTLGMDARLGKRFNIDNYNYLTFGGQYSTDVGAHDGVQYDGTYSVGPYIGLQRHFPGTGIMLTAFIYPYAHSVMNANDGEGGHLSTTADTFLANGGFGIAYLF